MLTILAYASLGFAMLAAFAFYVAVCANKEPLSKEHTAYLRSKTEMRVYRADNSESLNGAAGRALLLAREHGPSCLIYHGVAVVVQPLWTPAIAASFWQKCRTIANGYEQCEVRKA